MTHDENQLFKKSRRIYAGRGVSAINNNQAVDRRGIPGAALTAKPDPKFLPDDPSTDKYYRTGGSVAGRRGQPLRRQLPTPESPSNLARSPLLKTRDQVNAVIAQIMESLQQNYRPVVVQVAPGLGPILLTQLELGVARGRLTEADLNDIKIRPLAASTKALIDSSFGAPVPPRHVAVEEPVDLSVDAMRDIVMGGEDEDIDTAIAKAAKAHPKPPAASAAVKPAAPANSGFNGLAGQTDPFKVPTIKSMPSDGQMAPGGAVVPIAAPLNDVDDETDN